MGKLNLSKVGKTIGGFATKHAPEILTGIGITGMLTSIVMAVTDTPKALELIEDKKEQEGVETLTPMETVKTTWKCYVPSAITFILSGACIIGGQSVNTKRNAALATAYSLSEAALKEYRAKVVETIGERKEHLIRDEIAKDKIERNPICNTEVIITEKGNTLCYDSISGRYFKSDIEKIRKAVNELNRQMMDDMYISLNDLYFYLGLSGTDIGNRIGWNISKGFIDIRFSSQLSEDEQPCLVLDYIVAPTYDFQHAW